MYLLVIILFLKSIRNVMTSNIKDGIAQSSICTVMLYITSYAKHTEG